MTRVNFCVRIQTNESFCIPFPKWNRQTVQCCNYNIGSDVRGWNFCWNNVIFFMRVNKLQRKPKRNRICSAIVCKWYFIVVIPSLAHWQRIGEFVANNLCIHANSSKWVYRLIFMEKRRPTMWADVCCFYAFRSNHNLECAFDKSWFSKSTKKKTTEYLSWLLFLLLLCLLSVMWRFFFRIFAHPLSRCISLKS